MRGQDQPADDRNVLEEGRQLVRALHAVELPEGMGEQGREGGEAGQDPRAEPANRRLRKSSEPMIWVATTAAATGAEWGRPRPRTSAVAPPKSSSLAMPLIAKGETRAKRATRLTAGDARATEMNEGAAEWAMASEGPA